jgi:hypothetical protein
VIEGGSVVDLDLLDIERFRDRLHLLIAEIAMVGVHIPDDIQEPVAIVAVFVHDLGNRLQTAHASSFPGIAKSIP